MVQERTKKWEENNSKWFWWNLTILLCGVALIIPGRKLQRKSWQLFGYGYIVTLISLLIIAQKTLNINYFNAAAIVIALCIVHSFSVKKEYLNILWESQNKISNNKKKTNCK